MPPASTSCGPQPRHAAETAEPAAPQTRAVCAEATVRRFWALMATNDFGAVAQVLDGEAFTLEWPQSRERIRGAARFAQMNAEYPAHGRWRFQLRRLVAGADGQVATEVDVDDGVQAARALSFFRLDGPGQRIVHLCEYWPEGYAAPAHRAHLCEPMDPAEGLPTPG